MHMAKIFNRILGNWIKQHIKRVIYYDLMEFIPGRQRWFNVQIINNIIHINRMKGKRTPKTMWSCQLMQKKPFNRTQHSFIIKTLNKLGIGANYLNMIRNIYEKFTANNILNGESESFHSRSETEQTCFCPVMQHCTRSSSQSN